MGGQDVNALGAAFNPKVVEMMETPALSAEEVATEFALRGAPTLAELYTADMLAKDSARPRFPIRALPAWPNNHDAPDGHGWGRALDRALGGLVPSRVLLLGAAGAKAGKTSFLMQLADGLALHSAEVAADDARPGPLMPTLILSEMSAAALTFRTLGRWFGRPARLFGSAPDAELDTVTELTPEQRAAEVERIRDVQKRARAALAEGGALSAMRRFQRIPNQAGYGAAAIANAARTLDAWREELAKETRRDVWPVLVVDPIQRFADPKEGEVEGLNALAETLRRSADGSGLIVLLTSDTNKASAKGDPDEGARDPGQEAAAILRGSYALPHAVDAALILKPDPDGKGQETAPGAARSVVVSVGLNRWLSLIHISEPTRPY